MTGFFSRRAVPRARFVTKWPVECALALGPLGVKVFPAKKKLPRIKGWQDLASCDPARILEWEAQFPLTAFAARTGHASGVAVIDVDDARGAASLARLEGEHGALPPTWRTRSGREGPGFHLWFGLDPSAPEPRNGASVVAPGIDIRGRGGLILLPGAPHASGRRYAWEVSPSEVQLAPLPPAWAAIIPISGEKRIGGGSRVGARGSGARRTGRIVMGDGDEGQGYQGPINSLCCAYFAADRDAPFGPLLEALSDAIERAPRDPKRDMTRYFDPNYLEEAAEKARDFIVNNSENADD